MAADRAPLREKARAHQRALDEVRERIADWQHKRATGVRRRPRELTPGESLLRPADVARITGLDALTAAAYVRPAYVFGPRGVRWHPLDVRDWMRAVARGKIARPEPVEVRTGLSLAVRQFVLARDGAVCGVCGAVGVPFHVDHKHPVARGGVNELDNLWILCAPCNLSKGARTVDEFLARRAGR